MASHFVMMTLLDVVVLLLVILNWVALQKFELYSERFIFGFDLKNEDIFFLWLGLIYRLNVLLQVWTGLGDVYHL